jgi:hypothetical protein
MFMPTLHLSALSENRNSRSACPAMRVVLPILFLLAVVFLGALAACNSCTFVTPNTSPAAPPKLAINVYDYTFTTCTQGSCTCCSQLQSGSARTDSCPNSQCNPIALSPTVNGSSYTWFLSDLLRPNFDSLISVIATDPTGVQSLAVTYTFLTCPTSPDITGYNSMKLMSFNNGGYIAPSNSFTLNSTPGPPNKNQAVTQLAFPITITTTDLKSIACPTPPGGNSSGLGDLFVNVQASNFSATSTNKTSHGQFLLQIGAVPLPQQ